MDFANVKEYNAAGDGVADDSAAIQAALFSGKKRIVIPAGNYRVVTTLRVPSDTRIEADADARIFSCGDTPKKRGDFLLTNSDHVNGNVNIELCGGIWDGNNQGKYNTKNPDLFDQNAWSGTVLNFFNVRNLLLENLVIANSVIYNTRFCKVENFIIRNIGFKSDRLAFNQDGLHFAGFVRNGVIENVRALSKGQTNDDLLALNADDSLVRLENLDLLCGPIENLTFRDIYAEDCHTAVRILSVNSPIRNIRIENLTAGCRCFAINMDAARYCRTPLFKDEECPDGVGKVENIVIENMTVWRTNDQSKSMICCENNVSNFKIKQFKRDLAQDVAPENPTLLATNLPHCTITADQVKFELKNKKDTCIYNEAFSTLELD